MPSLSRVLVLLLVCALLGLGALLLVLPLSTVVAFTRVFSRREPAPGSD